MTGALNVLQKLDLGSNEVTDGCCCQEGQSEETAEAVLAPGSSHTFPERTANMGTWTAVRKIRHLRANIAGEEFEKHVEEDCEGVHSNIHYTVHQEKTFNVKAKN